MKKNIAIIGAGQLGSRHLQSLADLNGSQFEIVVFDTQQQSLDIAKSRYLECLKSNSPSVSYTSEFDSLPNHLSVVIIATNSIVRSKVIHQLLGHSKVEHLILEKFLFPSLDEYDEIQTLLEANNVNTYVNTPRRAFPYFIDIKKKLSSPFHMELIGVNWGMGCNAIHFLDLLSYLIDSTEIEIINLLDEEIISSKRSGYIEFTGSLFFKDKNKNTCILTSYPEGKRPNVLSISDKDNHYVFHEAVGNLFLYQKEESGQFEFKKNIISAPKQSESTSVLVTDLLNNGTCSITKYSASAVLHKKLLNVYLEQYSKSLDKTMDSCPIT